MTVDTAYDGESARAYDQKRFSSPGGKLIHRREVEILSDALRPLDPDSTQVLEVGCGTGRLLAEVDALGFRATGIDPSPYMLEEARRRLSHHERLRLIKGEAAGLPVDSGSFDFVYSLRVLNQTESREYALAAIGEMMRAAKKGGRVLIEFMNERRARLEAASVRLGNEVCERKGGGDVRLRRRDVAGAAAAAGGRVVGYQGAFLVGMTGYYRAPPWALSLIDVVDRMLSRMLPGWCSRCYAVIEKL